MNLSQKGLIDTRINFFFVYVTDTEQREEKNQGWYLPMSMFYSLSYCYIYTARLNFTFNYVPRVHVSNVISSKTQLI